MFRHTKLAVCFLKQTANLVFLIKTLVISGMLDKNTAKMRWKYEDFSSR